MHQVDQQNPHVSHGLATHLSVLLNADPAFSRIMKGLKTQQS